MRDIFLDPYTYAPEEREMDGPEVPGEKKEVKLWCRVVPRDA